MTGGAASAPITYFSICSGIEAATVAWHPLGWRPVGFSEIDAFPRAVLAHHYPLVPLHGDFTRLIDEPPLCDLLVGGTPCQAFSIAGLRDSLNDDRGNLTLEFVRLLDAIDDVRRRCGKPRALAVWENVPGVLNTDDNAFGCFLAALAGEPAALRAPRGGWTYAGVVVGPERAIAWRKFDAQYFGLAQRRERVFAVIGPRDWPVADALFPVGEGVRRDSPPRREKGTQVAGALAGVSPNGGWRIGSDEAAANQLIPAVAHTLSASRGAACAHAADLETYLPVAFGGNNRSGPIDVAPALAAHGGPHGRMDFTVETFCVTGQVTHALRADGFDASEDGTGRGTPIVPAQTILPGDVLPFDGGQITRPANRSNPQPGSPCHALATGDAPMVAFRTSPNCGAWETGDRTDALTTSTDPNAHVLLGSVGVRRLTSRECERLQGFPDDYTLVPVRGGMAADGPRYKALGNSMPVPVMRWIGARIEAVRRLVRS